MQIHRLPIKKGFGIITCHTQQLQKEGYEIIEFRLTQLDKFNFKPTFPVIMEDNSIQFKEANFITEIKRIHSSGGKVAVLFDDYEANKDRLSIVKDLIEKGEDFLNLKNEDVIFFQAKDGFSI